VTQKVDNFFMITSATVKAVFKGGGGLRDQPPKYSPQKFSTLRYFRILQLSILLPY